MVHWEFHRANRSLVIREALARFQEELAGKSRDFFRYFIDRPARRAAMSRKGLPIVAGDADRNSTTR
jgi:hypothetical protein